MRKRERKKSVGRERRKRQRRRNHQQQNSKNKPTHEPKTHTHTQVEATSPYRNPIHTHAHTHNTRHPTNRQGETHLSWWDTRDARERMYTLDNKELLLRAVKNEAKCTSEIDDYCWPKMMRPRVGRPRRTPSKSPEKRQRGARGSPRTPVGHGIRSTAYVTCVCVYVVCGVCVCVCACDKM
jgi:hypothetical protein